MIKNPLKFILIILDGFGLRDNKEGNAYALANTPILDKLFKEYPKSGFENYHQVFESHNLLKDKLCAVNTDKKALEGKVLGVNKSGELLFERNGEIQHLRYGEVSIREL